MILAVYFARWHSLYPSLDVPRDILIMKREAANAVAVADKIMAKVQSTFAIVLLFVEFVGDLCWNIWAVIRDFISDICGLCPLDSVFDYSLNVGIII